MNLNGGGGGGVPGDTPIWVRYDGKFLDCIPLAMLAVSATPPRNVEILGMDGWMRPQKIARRMSSEPICTLRTGDAIVRATGSHLILANGLFVRADNVKVGDRLRLSEPQGSELTTTTGEFAWLLGFFAAEGTVTRDRVSWSNANRGLLGKTKELLEQVYATVTPLYEMPHRSTGAAEIHDRLVARWFLDEATATYRIPRTEWVKGGGRARRNDSHASFKKVPRLILNASHDIVQSFLDGYIDGDGYRSANGIVTQDTADYVLAEGLHYLYSRVSTELRADWRHQTKPNHHDVFSLATLLGTRPRRIAKDVVQKIHIQQDWHDYLYEIECEGGTCTFLAGVGSVVLHGGKSISSSQKLLEVA